MMCVRKRKSEAYAIRMFEDTRGTLTVKGNANASPELWVRRLKQLTREVLGV
jgi:hypothetical protein